MARGSGTILGDGTLIRETGLALSVVKGAAGIYTLTLSAPGFAEGVGAFNIDVGESQNEEGFKWTVAHTSDTVKVFTVYGPDDAPKDSQLSFSIFDVPVPLT